MSRRKIKSLVRNLAHGGTASQKAHISDLRSALLREIKRFRTHQDIYMPNAHRYLDLHDPDDCDIKAEDITLGMPSELGNSTYAAAHWPLLNEWAAKRACMSSSCAPGLVDLEIRLRVAELRDALDHLRRELRIRTYITQGRSKNVKGQRGRTSVSAQQERVAAKLAAYKLDYRYSWTALKHLLVGIENSSHLEPFQDLEDSDVRPLNEAEADAQDLVERQRIAAFTQARENSTRRRAGEEEEEASDAEEESHAGGAVFGNLLQPGESRRSISWIWRSTNIGELASEDKMLEALGAEYAKSKARAMRWLERLILQEEEMRRTIVYGLWRGKWWDGLASRRAQAAAAEGGELDVDLVEGLAAYAAEQGDNERSRAWGFDEQWKEVRAVAGRILAEVSLTKPCEVDVLERLCTDLKLE